MLKKSKPILAFALATAVTLGGTPLQVLADSHETTAATVSSMLLLDKSVDLEQVARIRALETMPLSLELTDVPDMQPIVEEYLNGESGKQWAIVLGKAFFWEQGAGSDGQACASCHFQAGADPRSKNQISPGLLNQTPGVDTQQFNFGGPNFQLEVSHFPTDRALDDTISSSGVFNTTFDATDSIGGNDQCTPVLDTFSVNGIQTRRVEPRNTPTVINAVFNHRNFWDGRANNIFNGVDPHGRRTNLMNPINPTTFEGQGIWVEQTPGNLVKVQIELPNSSLASQAVGPILSDVEMSCAGRTFPDVAEKLLRRDTALQEQRVSPTDSVLGPHVHPSGIGLKQDYIELISLAFKRKYWAGGVVPGTNPDGIDQLRANFALIWGLAIQFYEATLVSNQTPFDDFARGDDYALSQKQLDGLELFLSERSQCILCHGKREFTLAAVRERIAEPMERMAMADFLPGHPTRTAAVYDGGFYNIGATPTSADLGIGGTVGQFANPPGNPDAVPPIPDGPITDIPLCYSRQAADGPRIDQESTGIAFGDEAFPDLILPGAVGSGERVACDGAFKVPTLRNVELTAPYFHNGSHATLEQVMESYSVNMTDRFANENFNNLAPGIPLIDIDENDEELLIVFMKALTDKRVLWDMAPFDHPELKVPNGHPGNQNGTIDSNGDGLADDNFMTIPAVGASGRVPPAPFLGIDQ